MNLKNKSIDQKKGLKIRLLLAFALSVLFVNIVIFINIKRILSIDVIAYKIFATKLREFNLTNEMTFISSLIEPKFIIPIGLMVMILIFMKNKLLSIIVPINICFVGNIVNVLKNVYERPRPPVACRLIEISGYSFPSGHSMISMSFYGLLIYIIYRLVKNKIIKTILITLLVIIILLIGISRIYLGVHYFSDVIAGFTIALIYLIIISILIDKYIIKVKEDE